MSHLQLSYFEFYELSKDIFVSLFKTTKTTFDEDRMPKAGDRVFPNLPNDYFFYRLILALQKNNFGFYDTFFFLKKKADYTLSEIKEWMSSLVYQPTTNITECYGECYLTSTIDPEFKLSVYVKSDPLPQEAIDVIPIFKSANGENYVILGTKKKSPNITVSFDERKKTVDVLSVGLFGKVILGEHLEEKEKKRMEETRANFSNKAVQMSSKDISPVLRTLLEEGGFKLDSAQIDCYYVHFDNRPARDPRYTIYNTKGDDKDEIFGYMRDSTSDTVVALIKGEPPVELPDPVDSVECDKPIIVKAKDALSLLTGNDDRFAPAFWSHVIQLAIALNSNVILSEEEQEEQRKYVGMTVSDAKKVYDKGNICVGMMEGWAMKSGNSYDKTCMNVSVAANGKIDRILGFY